MLKLSCVPTHCPAEEVVQESMVFAYPDGMNAATWLEQVELSYPKEPSDVRGFLLAAVREALGLDGGTYLMVEEEDFYFDLFWKLAAEWPRHHTIKEGSASRNDRKEG